VYPLAKRGTQWGKPVATRGEEKTILSDKVLPQDIFEGYGGDQQRLASYSTLIGVFNLIFAFFLLLTKALRRPLPEHIELKDIALLGVATHKLSMIGAKDAVTSPLRAPFTELQEMKSQKQVEEKPRGEGLRRSLGELLTCHFCLGLWVAAFFSYGLVLAPRVTRLVASIFAILALSDHLHQAYKALTKRA
jgi:hypothetical protein